VINKNILQAIGKKEMDRKDFLKFSGLAILSLVGVGKVVSLLTKTDNSQLAITKPHEQTTRGYSGGGYSN
jgi:hypothetical protein